MRIRGTDECLLRSDRPDGPANLGLLLEGMLLPRLSEESLYIALGLVGTTIVPYNLFLYSSVIREGWDTPKDLRAARMDLLGAALLGGCHLDGRQHDGLGRLFPE